MRNPTTMKEAITKIVLLIFVLIVISLFVKGYLYKKEIAENRKTTICQFVKCKRFPKTSASYFEYYVNGKLYREDYGTCPEDCEQRIGKYYIINYSNIDPTKITVDFSEEEKDTVKIIDAGFNLNK